MKEKRKKNLTKAEADKQFAQIYEDNFNKIYRYCYSRLLKKDLAEDITSKTFGIAYEKLLEGEYREEGHAKSWLIRIARYTMNNYFRKKREINLPEGMPEVRDEREGIEEMILTKEQISLVMKEFEKLDSETREVLSLKIWEEYKFGEIAEITEKKESTVKSIYYRGLKKVKEELRRKEMREYAVVMVGVMEVGKSGAFVADVAFKKAVIKGISVGSYKLLIGSKMFAETVTIFGKAVSTTTKLIYLYKNNTHN